DMSRTGRQLVDGGGVERVIGTMMRLAYPLDKDRLEIRRATPQDAKQFWQLANDPVVRMNSFNPEPIPLEHHLEWYKSKLSSPDSCIWVLEVGGVIAAQARYDRSDAETAEIDFSVVAVFRGQGLGTKILELTWNTACKELGVKRARGVVLSTNMASVRSFLKSGFRQVSECQI